MQDEDTEGRMLLRCLSHIGACFCSATPCPRLTGLKVRYFCQTVRLNHRRTDMLLFHIGVSDKIFTKRFAVKKHLKTVFFFVFGILFI